MNTEYPWRHTVDVEKSHIFAGGGGIVEGLALGDEVLALGGEKKIT